MLANMSLSEYFDYKPWDPNYIVTCDLQGALMFKSMAAESVVIENIAIIEYDHKTRSGMNETTYRVYVCFIKYSDLFLRDYDPISQRKLVDFIPLCALLASIQNISRIDGVSGQQGYGDNQP